MKKKIMILGAIAVVLLMVSSATAVANTQSQTIDNMVEDLKYRSVGINEGLLAKVMNLVTNDDPNDPQPTFILLPLRIALAFVWLCCTFIATGDMSVAIAAAIIAFFFFI